MMIGDEHKQRNLVTFNCGIQLDEQAQQRVQALFQRLDTDNSGALSPSDFEPLENALCPADAARITRKNVVMRKIIDELKLSEADANGDGLVDFEEFVTAFKAYAMRQQTEVNTAGRKLTFEQYFQGLTVDLNKRVIDIVGQMATALAQ